MAAAEDGILSSVAGRLPGGMHYAWVMVALISVVQTVGYSISMAVGVVVIPLSDPEGDFGWSMAIIGSALIMYYLVGALLAPLTGWMGDRYGARRMLLLGGLLFGGSMILTGTVSHPWQFILTFGLLLAIPESICLVPLTAAINWWFKRRLGVGVGIIWAAGGIGTAALAPILGYSIDHLGWRATFWGVGILGGSVLMLLLGIFRNRPRDIGLEPYGSLDDDPPEVVRSEAMERLRAKVFNQQIRRTKAFWNLPTIHGLGCAGHGIVLIFATYIAYDRGTSYVEALLILSVLNIFSIVSRFITPILAERFGGKHIMALAQFTQGITVLILFWAHDLWAFYLFGMLFGLGFGGEMSAYLVVNRQYFGSGPIATCYGFQIMGALMGHAIATGLAGVILYATDSFTAILAMSMAFSFVGMGVIMTLEPSSRMLIPDWEDLLPPEARSTPPPSTVLLPNTQL